jgi:hypothetical protein
MSNESSAKTNASAMHTPGPWLISTPNSNEYTRGVHGAQIGDDFSFVICDLADDGYPEHEREANARLIAAAPALAEACKTFGEWLRREEDGFFAWLKVEYPALAANYADSGAARESVEGEAAWRLWYHGNLEICSLAQSQARAALALAGAKS